MKTFREIDNKRTNLNEQARMLKEEEDLKYSLYEKFLSPEYMEWLLKVASSMTLKYDENTKENAQTLLSIINDYMSHNDLKRSYNIIDDGESPKYSRLDYQIALNYQGMIGYLVSKHVRYNQLYQVYDAFNITISKESSYNTPCDVIDMDKLVEYALNVVANRQESPNMIDKIIENLRSEGLNSQEIMNLLEVAYTKVANEEISKRR